MYNIALSLVLAIGTMAGTVENAVTKYSGGHVATGQAFQKFTETSSQFSEQDQTRIYKAVSFAAEKHQHQKRKDAAGTPYIIHPIQVAHNLLTIGKVSDPEIIIAALLHDTVEDTQTTFEEIRLGFGEKVEGYVREVTDDKSLAKAERKRLQIEHAPHKSQGAALIKLADKLNNLEGMVTESPAGWEKERVDAYFTWAEKVVNALPKVNAALKAKVDETIASYRCKTGNVAVLQMYDAFVAELKKNELNDARIYNAIVFASEKHRSQKRLDAAKTPYIIHPIGVAYNILAIGNVRDPDVLIGALLHDTVEDTQTTFEEIRLAFGEKIEGYVREVTDDQSLPEEKINQQQLENAPGKSEGAAYIKLADTLYNLSDLVKEAPKSWSKEYIDEYVAHMQTLVNALPKVNAALKAKFDETIVAYKLK